MGARSYGARTIYDFDAPVCSSVLQTVQILSHSSIDMVKIPRALLERLTDTLGYAA